MVNEKILLVEDESIEALDIKRTLESFGYKVPYVATNGEEAVEKALKIMPDLILMDIVLKGDTDGIEAISKIKGLNIPVIYLTAHSEESTIERAKLTQPAGYIIKPYDSTELKYAIELAIYKNQMEKELKASEMKYKTLFEGAGVGIGYYDLDGRIISYNNIASAHMNSLPEELEGKTLNELFGVETASEYINRLEKTLETGESNIYEDQVKLPKETKWFQSTYNRVEDAEGNIIGVQIISQDITELKRSEELLRGLFDNMPSGMAIYQVKNDGSKGSDYMIREFNQTSQKIEGMKREDVIGKSLFDIRPNIDDYGLIPIFKKVWLTGEPVRYPAKIYTDENYANWYENYVFKAPTGEIVSIYNDVTEQTKTGNELKKSQEFLENIVENIPNMIFVKSAEKLKFKMVNKAAEELLGRSREELLGKNDFDFFPQEEADFFTQKDREVLQNKKLLDIPEETIETKNLGQRILHTKKIPILSKDGNPQYLLGISEDITELKKAEEALIKSEKRFSYLLEGMKDGVTLTHHGIITYANPFMANILGFKSSEQLIGKNLLDFMAPQSKKEVLIEMNKIQARSDDIKPSLEIDFARPDGSIVTTETITGSMELDGKIYGIGIYKDTTDKIIMQKALQRSEERYRTLYSSMNEGVAIHEVIYDDNNVPVDYEIVDVNPAYEEILGIKREDVLERKASEIYGTGKAPYLDIFFKVAQTGNSENFETYFEPMDKYFRISVFSPSKGTFATVFEDITIRKKTEENLRKSEKKYRHMVEDLKSTEKALIESERNYRELVNNSLVGIFKTNLQGDILFANEAIAKILHYQSIEDLMEHNIKRIYKNQGERNLLIRKLEKTGQLADYEVEGVGKNGQTVNLLVSANLDGDVISGMFMDITDRKKSELKLKESEEQINAIFNTVISGIILVDPEGFINFANQYMAKMFGFKLQELVGMSYLDLTINKERTEAETNMFNLIKGEIGHVFLERQYRRKDGTVFWGNLSGTRILNADGSLKGLIGVITDISESKKYADALKQSLNEKDALLREIHHRVKNNMQIISSLLNLQIKHEDLDETVNVLKESQGRVKSMAMIHEKLYQSPSFTDINFKDYIEKLVFDIFSSYGIKFGSIKSVLDIEEVNLNIDTAIPLGLIVNELVTNCVKYAFPKGEGTITINLKSFQDKMEFTIADDGIGMPKNIDIKNTNTLGLQLVNGLVNQIDGSIDLDRNHGTKFKITFKELKYKERLGL